MLGFLQQKGVDVDARVLGGLLIQQRKGQRYGVLGAVLPPDAGAEAEATVALDQNEVLLPVSGRR